MNNHDRSSRVDLHTSGQVTWHAGGASHGWISMTGMTFATDTQQLVLANGWQDYGGGYQGATYQRIGGVCLFSGLVKNGGWSNIANLPKECHPDGRLVVDANNHGKSARIDIKPDGSMDWIAGGRDHSWISLTGITYSVNAVP